MSSLQTTICYITHMLFEPKEPVQNKLVGLHSEHIWSQSIGTYIGCYRWRLLRSGIVQFNRNIRQGAYGFVYWSKRVLFIRQVFCVHGKGVYRNVFAVQVGDGGVWVLTVPR